MDNLTKISAACQLDLNDIQQRVDRIVKIRDPTDNIRKLLPLKSIEKINNLEIFLKEKKNLVEYVSENSTLYLSTEVVKMNNYHIRSLIFH